MIKFSTLLVLTTHQFIYRTGNTLTVPETPIWNTQISPSLLLSGKRKSAALVTQSTPCGQKPASCERKHFTQLVPDAPAFCTRSSLSQDVNATPCHRASTSRTLMNSVSHTSPSSSSKQLLFNTLFLLNASNCRYYHIHTLFHYLPTQFLFDPKSFVQETINT